MFKNTRMFSSGRKSTSLSILGINAKILFLTLMMVVVAFAGLSFSTGSVAHAETVSKEGRAVFLPGEEFNSKVKQIAGNSDPNGLDLGTDSIQRSQTLKDTSNIISTDDSDVPIYAWYNENDHAIYWYTEDPHPLLNEDASFMFFTFVALQNVDVSQFDTSNVTKMNGMFNNCGITSLDASNFNTSNVTDMSYMFGPCRSLESLDVSNFDTSNVTDMSYMFGESCLTSLDLSSFDTSNVTNTSNMFNWCSSLTTIYASKDMNTTHLTNSKDMFDSCTKLVGGNGTVYDSNHTDAEYARIDTQETPGYFTYKAPPFRAGDNADPNAATGNSTQDENGGVDVNIPVTKLISMNAKESEILQDFTFTMTPSTVAHTQDSYVGNTSPNPSDNTVTIKKEGFNAITNLTNDSKKVVISNDLTNIGNTSDVFTVHFNKNQIGQFTYLVTENTPNPLQAGMTIDNTIYKVVITIENDNASDITSGNVKCTGVTMAKSTDGGTTWEKTNTAEQSSGVTDRGGSGADIGNAKFTNTFHTADVLVDKTVRGSLGDKTKDFTFTFNVQGTNIPATYKLYKTNAANETAEPVDVQNGSTFTLKHGESAKVMGLPEGASYHITETGTADYTTKIDADLGDESFNGSCYTLVGDTAVAMNGDMYENVAGQTGGESIFVSKYNNEGSEIAITSASNLDEQHFTNMKGQLIPTGLIENMASFLGLALIAAFAIGYMIYKKKKDTVSEEA